MRVGTKYAHRTAGATWAMTADGVFFPPFEMPDAESTRMTVLSVVRWFREYEYPRGEKGPLVIVYDDSCHFIR